MKLWWVGAWICFALEAGAASGALGTSAVVDANGVLWLAHSESAGASSHVVVLRSADLGRTWDAPRRVTRTAEPISADGENRPKIAAGGHGELYVSWTSPTSAQYTADIRFARSLDRGQTWSAPITAHRDRQRIAHRFESLIVDREDRVWLVWVDKRDLAPAQRRNAPYAGAALYYAYSEDRGATWRGDFKLADHSCECCRIALSLNDEGRPAAMWRHVFEGGERDHALAVLTPGDRAPSITRATREGWRIDACPHHGPSLAFTDDGVAHAVWFSQVEGRGAVFLGQITQQGDAQKRTLPAGAVHADLAAGGAALAVAWKRFDGEVTRVETLLSSDAGRHFTAGPTFTARGDSDQPRVIFAREQLLLIWRRADGVAVAPLSPNATVQMTHNVADSKEQDGPLIKPFEVNTLEHIKAARGARPFWLVLWDQECGFCMQSLRNLAAAQQRDATLDVVTVATDSMEHAAALHRRLNELGVHSEAYAFGSASAEALRYSIDPQWLGEKPRAYRIAKGRTTMHTGVVETAEYLGE